MKRLIFTTICALAFTGVAFAQGTLNWSAFNPAAITAETNTSFSPLYGSGGGGVHGPIAPANIATFYFELLYNTTPFTGGVIAQPNTLSHWQVIGLTPDSKRPIRLPQAEFCPMPIPRQRRYRAGRAASV